MLNTTKEGLGIEIEGSEFDSSFLGGQLLISIMIPWENWTEKIADLWKVYHVNIYEGTFSCSCFGDKQIDNLTYWDQI